MRTFNVKVTSKIGDFWGFPNGRSQFKYFDVLLTWTKEFRDDPKNAPFFEWLRESPKDYRDETYFLCKITTPLSAKQLEDTLTCYSNAGLVPGPRYNIHPSFYIANDRFQFYPPETDQNVVFQEVQQLHQEKVLDSESPYYNMPVLYSDMQPNHMDNFLNAAENIMSQNNNTPS